MRSYDLHVHSTFSGGTSSLEELASTAKQLGYAGICFVTYPLSKREEEILKAEVERVKSRFDVEILLGVEARNVKELKMLKARMHTFDILLARGGNTRLNAAAVSTPGVQILTHPEFEREDPGLNHVLVKEAAKNGVAIEINLREVLIASKRTRVKVLENIARNVMLAKKFHTPLVICSGAVSHWMMRDPQVLVSLAVELGLSIKEAKNAIIEVPRRIVEQAKKRRDGKLIMEGVEVVG